MQFLSTKKLSDTECNNNFDAFLRVFHKIENERPKEDYKEQLHALKSTVQNTIQLTGRQREAIIDRCNNVLNGTYGNTKRPEHYEQSKPAK